MHVMLDLETMGTRAGAVILSIGAVAFNEEGIATHKTPYQFHVHLDIIDQMAKGAHLDPKTVLWWLDQKKEAQQAIVDGQKSRKINTYTALSDFGNWFREMGGEEIWGNGADFDLPLLSDMFQRFSVAVPWGYNKGRCCRTVMALAGVKMGHFGTKNALAHDALADAIYQASEVAAAMRSLRRSPIATLGAK